MGSKKKKASTYFNINLLVKTGVNHHFNILAIEVLCTKSIKISYFMYNVFNYRNFWPISPRSNNLFLKNKM